MSIFRTIKRVKSVNLYNFLLIFTYFCGIYNDMAKWKQVPPETQLQTMTRGVGRPRKVIDYDLTYKLSEIQCTMTEMSYILGISVKALERDKQFVATRNKALSEGCKSLRRLQWDKAQAGNVGMLIWLGKQYLGQLEKQEVKTPDLGDKSTDECTDEELMLLIKSRRRSNQHREHKKHSGHDD